MRRCLSVFLSIKRKYYEEPINWAIEIFIGDNSKKIGLILLFLWELKLRVCLALAIV